MYVNRILRHARVALLGVVRVVVVVFVIKGIDRRPRLPAITRNLDRCTKYQIRIRGWRRGMARLVDARRCRRTRKR